MQSKNSDIRRELESRIAEVQGEIGSLQESRGKIEKKLQEAEAKLSALRTVYQIEAERLGEPRVPLFAKEGVPYRFSGLKLTEALAIIRRERPEINKKEVLNVLEKEGFDFRGRRPLTAVHFAWIALDRRTTVRK